MVPLILLSFYITKCVPLELRHNVAFFSFPSVQWGSIENSLFGNPYTGKVLYFDLPWRIHPAHYNHMTIKNEKVQALDGRVTQKTIEIGHGNKVFNSMFCRESVIEQLLDQYHMSLVETRRSEMRLSLLIYSRSLH